MAKRQPVARTRRGYEYDHHYGVALTGKAVTKTSRGRTSQSATSPHPAKARSTKRSVKKR